MGIFSGENIYSKGMQDLDTIKIKNQCMKEYVWQKKTCRVISIKKR